MKKIFSKENQHVWLVWILFFFSIFTKELLFHWYVYHNILLSSLWRAPLEFFAFWTGKLIPALCIASFVFLCKRQWWTIAVNIIIDIWCIVNLIFVKSYGSLITWSVLSLSSNMKGFEDSVWVYVQADVWSFLLIGLLYCVFIAVIGYRKQFSRRITAFACTMALVILLSIGDKVLYAKQLHHWIEAVEMQAPSINTSDDVFYSFFPFGDAHYMAKKIRAYDDPTFAKIYTSKQSIVSYLFAMPLYHLWTTGKTIELTDDEIAMMQNYYSKEEKSIAPKTSLIIILVESFESWAIETVDGIDYMPNVKRLAYDNHSLYCKRLGSETKHGNSGDGQMIMLTGLLPIDDGAACCMYDHNVYPSFVHLFDDACIVNPSPGAWHQTEMSENYGFTDVVEPNRDEHVSDEWIANHMTESLRTPPQCVLGITMASHLPFTHGKEHVFARPQGMPEIMSNYLNCMHYTDSCIGILVDRLQADSMLSKVNLVITGDHAIFRADYDNELDDYASSHGIDFKQGRNYLPLIINSPLISQNISKDEVFYQMDIYPTIMHLYGDYAWKGLGVDILDNNAVRTMSEDDAYYLSNRLIRSNYFSRYDQTPH